MKTLKKISDTFLFTNAYLGFCVLALYFAFPKDTLPVWDRYLLAAFVYFATVGVYSILRIRALQFLSNETSVYLEWLKKNFALASGVKYISIAATIIIFLFLRSSYQGAILSLGIVWVLYNLPLFTLNRIKSGLRYVWFLKPFIVGFIVAALTTFIPYYKVTGSPNTLYLFAATSIIFCFASAIVVLFEIKDVKLDRPFHTNTIPIKIGINGTKIVACILLLICIGLTVLFFYHSGHDLIKLLPLILFLYITILGIKEDRSEYFYWVIVDGWMLLLGLSWYCIDHLYILS